MSLSKGIGALAGAAGAALVAALYIGGLHLARHAPATVVVATLLAAVMVGAVMGAYVGATDRR